VRARRPTATVKRATSPVAVPTPAENA